MISKLEAAELQNALDCPFCGGDPAMESEDGQIRICCIDCGGCGPLNQDVSDSVRAWNMNRTATATNELPEDQCVELFNKVIDASSVRLARILRSGYYPGLSGELHPFTYNVITTTDYATFHRRKGVGKSTARELDEVMTMLSIPHKLKVP